MRIRILGSAAGGGFPQWNCGCGNCAGVREKKIAAEPRTQDSVAVSADGERWLLLNASPDIRTQLAAFPALFPRRPRDTPIAAIALSNDDLDHCLGLFSLREAQPLVLYATRVVRQGLFEKNAIARTLERFDSQLRFVELEPRRPITLCDPRGAPLGLSLEAIALPGKPPLHLCGTVEDSELQNVGLMLRELGSDRTFVYATSVGKSDDNVLELMRRADCLLFDGTFWSSTELVDLGLSERRAEDMAHWPLAGEGGSFAPLWLETRGRVLLSHINNTNPILRADSNERRAIEASGIEVARDQMEIEL